jgi:hypothetical protein
MIESYKQETASVEELISKTSDDLKQTLNAIGYLEKQVAAYGILSVPLKLHNDLLEKRDLAEKFQLKLDQLLEQKPAKFQDAGKLLVPLPEDEEAHSVLIIESDVHWGNIFTEVVTAMKHKVKRCKPQEIVDLNGTVIDDYYRMAIIGQPTLEISQGAFSLADWTNVVVKISQTMPIILLTTRDALAISIQTRRSLIENNANALDTIQKETFHYERLVKRVRQALG